MFYEVIPEKIFRAGAGILTYSYPGKLLPGQIVEIPLGKSSTVGVIVKKVAQPNFATKSIIKILYSTPLPAHLIKLIFWMNEYYMVEIPQILSLILPSGITKNRRKAASKTEQTPIITAKTPKIELNTAQKKALEAILNTPGATKLLHGVTGSGKTNIYLEMAKNALNAEKSVILLVPEIALTSQLVRVFEQTFSQKIVLIHSRQTEAKRHKIWETILNSTFPLIVIGPRSALFAPLNNLGLILIDECHESSYFQENSPKYSTLRLASFMAKTLNVTCLEGSATPLLQDYYLAKEKNALITLTEKAKETAIKPTIEVIDFKDRTNFSKNRYFCTKLLNTIEDNLKNHKQTLIFHNRRGSSPLSICETCGEELLCPNCLLPLTLHSDSYELICHTCGHKEKVPKCCPKCGSPNILHKGFGTKLLESELKKLFKNARIARFDADNNKNETLDAMYDNVKSGNIDIIIGTQTIAKGLDLPNLKTVGIVQADSGLSMPDYSAEERTYELITQVIGRVGRGHLKEADVFIQTFKPDSNIIKFAVDENYADFATYTLKKRRITGFPPYLYLAKLEISLKTESLAIKKLRALISELKQIPGLTVSAPTPAFHEKTKTSVAWQLIIRSTSRQKLVGSLKNIDKNFKITLDPPSIL